MQAGHGNTVGAVGQTMRAIMEEAHAIACERGRLPIGRNDGVHIELR